MSCWVTDISSSYRSFTVSFTYLRSQSAVIGLQPREKPFLRGVEMRALKVKCSKTPLLTVQRSSQWDRRMVYILVANTTYKYPSGRRSRIIYIGTTGKGAGRPATSA